MKIGDLRQFEIIITIEYKKTMKFIICLLVSFTFVQANAQSKDFIGIDSIFIKRMPWNVDELRDPPLTCITFEEYGSAVGFIIKKEHNAQEISRLYKELKKMPESKPNVMDVRCKLYFYQSDTIVFTACIDYLTTLFNGCYYKTTPRLRKIIDHMTEKHKHKVFENKQINKSENYIIVGKDSLINYLQDQKHSIFRNSTKRDSVIIWISCNVNKQGETINAFVRQSNSVNKIPESTINHIKAILKNVIRWNINKERTVFDIITKGIKLLND